VKLYVEEDGSTLVREQVAAASAVATAAIAYVEARSALRRRRHAGDLSATAHPHVVTDLDADWERYVRLEVSEPLIRDAATLADRYRLRGYGAIHLAAAMIARQRLGDDLVFACWDDGLAAAASPERFATLRRSRRL
jgi:uncharacterized protein